VTFRRTPANQGGALSSTGPRRYSAICQFPKYKDADMFPLLADAHSTTVISGYGLGSMLAVVCSWERNRSILWAILAGFCTWFYVIYFALSRRPDEVK
jgi:hypothetical protein